MYLSGLFGLAGGYTIFSMRSQFSEILFDRTRGSAPGEFTLYFAAVLGIGHGTHLQEWGAVILPDRIKVAFISEGENTANRAEFF